MPTGSSRQRLEAFRAASGRFVLEQRAVAVVAVAPP